MVTRSRRSKAVDRLLSRVEPRQRAIAKALRTVILRTGPGLHEEVKWGAPCYMGTKLVCAITTHADHTNLEFYCGAALRDVDHLLEGTGKYLRHVRLSTVAQVRSARLQALLREAIAYDSR